MRPLPTESKKEELELDTTTNLQLNDTSNSFVAKPKPAKPESNTNNIFNAKKRPVNG